MSRQPRREPIAARLPYVLMILAGLACIVLIALSSVGQQGIGWLVVPAGLRPNSTADYNVQVSVTVPPVDAERLAILLATDEAGNRVTPKPGTIITVPPAQFTPGPTLVAQVTATPTPMATRTPTRTPPSTRTPTVTPSRTPTFTPTSTRMQTATPTFTPSPTPVIPTATNTSPPPADTATWTPTSPPSVTPSPTNTSSPTGTATTTGTSSPTPTPSVTLSPTSTPSPTVTPTDTPTLTATPSPTINPYPAPINCADPNPPLNCNEAGTPDGLYASVLPTQTLILDLGLGNGIQDGSGYDFVYYERETGTTGFIGMDWVTIELSSDQVTWYVAFTWNVGSNAQNSNIAPFAAPTPDPNYCDVWAGAASDEPIPMGACVSWGGLWVTPLSPQTGIAIDIGPVIPTIPPEGFRYIRIQGIDPVQPAEIDGIERLN